MRSNTLPWVIVLAAGSGTRLSELTVGADGIAVPKQFCSLRGGRSLLIDAIGRARHLTSRDRIVVIVAAEHERWWREQLRCIEPDNVLVQPQNRGTGTGIALAMAWLRQRDPQARFVLLPSDHYVERPLVLLGGLQLALRELDRAPANLMLLGISPDSPDSEYGWIAPGERLGRSSRVQQFVEKPDGRRAADLMAQGASWNSFLVVGEVEHCWRLCERYLPAAAAAITTAVGSSAGALPGAGAATGAARARALAMAYADLPSADFSRVVLEQAIAELRLVPVADCGWTDLGTPRRVAQCIADIELRLRGQAPRSPWFATVDLAEAWSRRQPARAATA